MHYVEERHPMDRQNQFLILFSGFLGLTLAILTARPKQLGDAIVAVLASLFGALFLGPAVAEGLTSVSMSFPSFSFLGATPGTSIYAAIIGLGGMLGFQIVIAVKSDFVDWVKQFARKRLGGKDDHIHESQG